MMCGGIGHKYVKYMFKLQKQYLTFNITWLRGENKLKEFILIHIIKAYTEHFIHT